VPRTCESTNASNPGDLPPQLDLHRWDRDKRIERAKQMKGRQRLPEKASFGA